MMKIELIETLVNDHLGVVRITTDDGVRGIGQMAPYEAAISASVLHRMVAPFFIGKDPWDLQALIEDCLRGQYKFLGSFLCRALAGVDTAIWDILGKVTQQPVYRLLGGAQRDTVPMYASSMIRDIAPEREAERLAECIAVQGFQAVKSRIGQPMGADSDASPGRSEKLIPLLREQLGDDIAISMDANGGYSAGRAIRIGRMLEDYGYFHFEEPCPFPEIESTAEVSRALDIPVSGGEQDNSIPQFARMIRMGAVDIVQPDIGYLGGLSRARTVALMAGAAGLVCTPHCANQSMLQLFSLHLAAAMPACSQFQEWSIEDISWTKGVYEPMLTVVNGSVALPTGPGWGVELLPEFESRAIRETTVAPR